MQKDLEILINALEKFEGLTLIESDVKGKWINFKLSSEKTLYTISSVVTEVQEYHQCHLLVLSSENDFIYQLLIESNDRIGAVIALTKRLMALHKPLDKNKELGLPDLSLVTIRQMANELKQRSNVVFALVWIENSERDNIAVEGSGNPTQLVGLLTRGTHMAIDWADKNIKFFKPQDGEDV